MQDLSHLADVHHGVEVIPVLDLDSPFPYPDLMHTRLLKLLNRQRAWEIGYEHVRGREFGIDFLWDVSRLLVFKGILMEVLVKEGAAVLLEAAVCFFIVGRREALEPWRL